MQELKDGRDEWSNFSGDGVAKGGKIFGVDGPADFLDEVRSSSRVSKYSFFIKRCVFSALVIWAAVPAGFGTRTPIFDGH